MRDKEWYLKRGGVRAGERLEEEVEYVLRKWMRCRYRRIRGISMNKRDLKKRRVKAEV